MGLGLRPLTVEALLRKAEAMCNTLIGRIDDKYTILDRKKIANEIWAIRHHIHTALDRMEADDADN